MKRHNIYIILFLSVVLHFFTSCTQDDGSADDISNGNGDIAIKVSFSKSSLVKATSENGSDALNENRIKTLDVFIYKENEDVCSFYQHIIPSTEVTGVGEYSATLDAVQESFTYDENYLTYVIVNYEGSFPSGGLTLSEIKDLSISGLNPDKVQDYFLMDGISSPMILNDKVIVNKEIPVSLKRASAKIRVGITYANNISLSDNAVISKKLVNYAINSSVLDNGNSITPDLQNMTDFTNLTSGANSNGKIVLYSYANDWNDDNTKETYIIINVPIKDASNVDHPQNYYKVPVNYLLPSDYPSNPTSEQEAALKALYKLQRNYLYDVTVLIDKPGSTDPFDPVVLTANYVIADWTTKDVIVEVEGLNFLFVKDQIINMPNITSNSTTFQSSTPDVTIDNITVNDEAIANGEQGVNITWAQNAKSGDITINSPLPINFVAKVIKFTVRNGKGLSQEITATQYPSPYLGSDISADEPGGSEGQNNNKMYIMNSLTADYSVIANPDEFDEDFGSGYSHYDPDPVLGASYAQYIRISAVLGYPKTDANGATIDSDENNRRISPRFMLASQHGTTTASNYVDSRNKCSIYVENDETTGERYSDWRMPTVAELYMIDVLQNTKVSEVKKILEGNYYWSSRASSAIKFMDPRVGQGTNFSPTNASVRCVRDVKEDR